MPNLSFSIRQKIACGPKCHYLPIYVTWEHGKLGQSSLTSRIMPRSMRIPIGHTKAPFARISALFGLDLKKANHLW